MAKGKRTLKAAADKRAAKEARMKATGGQSNYAVKRKYLDRRGGMGMDYLPPKPWKSKIT